MLFHIKFQIRVSYRVSDHAVGGQFQVQFHMQWGGIVSHPLPKAQTGKSKKKESWRCSFTLISYQFQMSFTLDGVKTHPCLVQASPATAPSRRGVLWFAGGGALKQLPRQFQIGFQIRGPVLFHMAFLKGSSRCCFRWCFRSSPQELFQMTGFISSFRCADFGSD